MNTSKRDKILNDIKTNTATNLTTLTGIDTTLTDIKTNTTNSTTNIRNL